MKTAKAYLAAAAVGLLALAPRTAAAGEVIVVKHRPLRHHQHYRAHHVWVPGHWVRWHLHRTWVPGHYQRV